MIYLLVLYRIDKIIGAPSPNRMLSFSIQIELIVRFQNSQYSTVKTSSQPLIVFHWKFPLMSVQANEKVSSLESIFSFRLVGYRGKIKLEVQPKQASDLRGNRKNNISSLAQIECST